MPEKRDRCVKYVFCIAFVGENVNILANEHETKNTCRGEKTHCRYSSATERNNI